MTLPTKVRVFQLLIIDALLTIAGVACLYAGIHAIYQSDSTLAAVALGASLLLFFAATLDRFEFLKGWGIEAKVRRLDNTISKAEIALEKLRVLTETTTRSVVMLASKAGRWNGAPSVDEAYQLASDARQVLQSAGSSPEIIRSILTPWAKTEASDMVSEALKPCAQELRNVIDKLQQELNAIKQPISAEDRPKYEALNARLITIKTHLNQRGKEVAQWPLGNVAGNLLDVVENAPELDRATKTLLKEELQPFYNEIAHLAEHLTFKHISFWRDHIRVDG